MMNKFNFLKFMRTVIAVCVVISLLCSCNSRSMTNYYSQKENYIDVTGTVSSMKYNDDATALYIGFSELTPVLDDTSFKIVGDNLQVVQNNKIDNKLRIGMQVSFVTAPRYFGDGYVMPIVALSVNGESLLDFEEGHHNLLNWLS